MPTPLSCIDDSLALVLDRLLLERLCSRWEAAALIEGSAVVGWFRSDPVLGDYELFATKATGDRVKIFEIKDGAEVVDDPVLFAEVIAPPGDAALLLGEKVIDEKVIAELTMSLPGERGKAVAAVLTPYVGQTWRHALDTHSQKKGQE
jgi:hypothetical protein